MIESNAVDPTVVCAWHHRRPLIYFQGGGGQLKQEPGGGWGGCAPPERSAEAFSAMISLCMKNSCSGVLLNVDKINQTLAQKRSCVVVVSSAAVLYPRLVSNISMHGSCTERFTFNNKQRC